MPVIVFFLYSVWMDQYMENLGSRLWIISTRNTHRSVSFSAA